MHIEFLPLDVILIVWMGFVQEFLRMGIHRLKYELPIGGCRSRFSEFIGYDFLSSALCISYSLLARTGARIVIDH